MAHYVVGDLHGCREQLESLLELVRFDPAQDKLWSVGDLVNRGPDSAGVLRLFLSLGEAAEAILGNHDLYLLGHTLAPAGEPPPWVKEFLQQADAEELLAWLRQRPATMHARLAGKHPHLWVLTHAGVHPDWNLALLTELQADIARYLAAQPADLLSCAMAPSLHWDSALSGLERAGVALGYLTRMRHMRADGSLDLSRARCGSSPEHPGWFDYPLSILQDGEPGEVQLLFGHWAALNGQVEGDHLHALDTGAVWGNQLTVLRLEDRQHFRVPGWQS